MDSVADESLESMNVVWSLESGVCIQLNST